MEIYRKKFKVEIKKINMTTQESVKNPVVLKKYWFAFFIQVEI